MRLDFVGIFENQIGREIERFLANTGTLHWKKLIKKFDDTEGNFYKIFLKSRNPLIESFKQYFQLYNEGRSIQKHLTIELRYLAKNAFIINRILHNINENAKKQILGRLLSDDIRPLIFELDIATHFFRKGFNLEFLEYERPATIGRIFDLLVSKNSIEGEVECKWKNYDTGRKIKLEGLYSLYDEIIKQLGNEKVKCVAEIICTKKLDKDLKFFTEIADKIKSGINKKETKIILESNFLINIFYLPENLEINSEEQIASVIDTYKSDRSHLGIVKNKEMFFVVKVESEKKDDILRNLYEELKDAKRQFSKKRPALIVLCLEGIYPEQWEELRVGSGLANMTSFFLSKENVGYVHTISYTSEIAKVVDQDGIMDYSYSTLFFRNENCNFYKGQSIFFEKS